MRRAVILAGGKGTRLKPYTLTVPKPLVPINDVPILDIILSQLSKFGFTHVTITLNHLAGMIKEYCGDGSKWSIKIDYSLETKPLSTIAPLKLIEDLPENFLIMNGDVLTDLDFAELYENHIANSNICSVSAYERDHKVDYGVLRVDNTGKLTKFEEKPVLNYLVSMGVNVLNRKCLDFVPEDTAYGVDNLMRDLLQNNTPAVVIPHKGYWLDIGRPSDYEQAIEDSKKMDFV